MVNNRLLFTLATSLVLFGCDSSDSSDGDGGAPQIEDSPTSPTLNFTPELMEEGDLQNIFAWQSSISNETELFFTITPERPEELVVQINQEAIHSVEFDPAYDAFSQSGIEFGDPVNERVWNGANWVQGLSANPDFIVVALGENYSLIDVPAMDVQYKVYAQRVNLESPDEISHALNLEHDWHWEGSNMTGIGYLAFGVADRPLIHIDVSEESSVLGQGSIEGLSTYDIAAMMFDGVDYSVSENEIRIGDLVWKTEPDTVSNKAVIRITQPEQLVGSLSEFNTALVEYNGYIHEGWINEPEAVISFESRSPTLTVTAENAAKATAHLLQLAAP